MANLLDLKKRIASTNSTQKITSAMKMVSVAKLKRASNGIENLSNYSRAILNSILYLKNSQNIIGFDFENSLIVNENSQIKNNIHIFQTSFGMVSKNINTNKPAELIIAISPDKGLCGSLNTNIISNLNAKITQLNKLNIDFVILPIGKKITDYCLAKHKSKIVSNFTSLQLKSIKSQDVKNVANNITNLFSQNKIDGVYVVYSKFISTIKQDITCKALVPFGAVETNSESNSNLQHDFLFEPSIEEVISNLVEERIISAILTFIKHTEASEHASRMIAMDNATKNSQKVIKDLKLKYNRGRQTAITSQILEIVGGMEAIV